MASDYDRDRTTRTTQVHDGAREVHVQPDASRTTTTTVHDTHEKKGGGLGRTLLLLLILAALAALAAVAFGLIDIDQTRELKTPEVKLEGGQAPAFDVDTADVDVKTENVTIQTPTIEVDKAGDDKNEKN